MGAEGGGERRRAGAWMITLGPSPATAAWCASRLSSGLAEARIAS
jgi:hypothetical protein